MAPFTAATTLDEAIAQDSVLLKARSDITADSGIEIWQQGDRLYSDQRHAGDTGIAVDINRPFTTLKSTMPFTWRSTCARLVSVMTGRKL